MRAVVLALGDGQSYILTTARNDLGVIQAKSLAGAALVQPTCCSSQPRHRGKRQLDLSPVLSLLRAGVPMVPISWEEMQCPQTAAVEKRKVAKVA